MNITSENKIPKIIHYFWMGNTPPPLMIKCMESWKKQLPDWEFRLWNEKSFDFNSILWCKQALKYKKYAFVADFVRFYALYTIGGIYLDSDVELLKPLDPFLCYRSFISDNFQSGVGIQAEVFGATPGTPWLKDCLDYYMNTEFINRDGSLNMRPVDYLVEKVIKGKHPDYK